MRPTAKSSGERVCEASTCSITNSRRSESRRKSRLVDTVEGVLGRGCVIPLRGWNKCDSGLQVLRIRSRKTAEPKLREDTQVSSCRVGGRKIIGVGGCKVVRLGLTPRERGPNTRRALTAWCRLGVPAGDVERQRSVDFVVKALPAVTTRRGSACVTSIERCVSNGSSGS